MTEDEMVGWHSRPNGRKFEQALGSGDGQGSLVCCSPWSLKESDMTQVLNNRNSNTSLCCTVFSHSVVFYSLQPHGRQPTRPRSPWGSLGKNTGVGCHVLLQCMKVKCESEVAQSCPTL